MSTLTGDPIATCRIQVTTPSQFHGVLMHVFGQIPPSTSVYIERRENLLTCQNKYILITADEGPCYAVIPHTKFEIVLQGNDSFNIGDIAIDHLSLGCQESQNKF